MSFVFSVWYIIALLLAAGVVACLIIFFKMDKQDKVIIKEFVDSNVSQSKSNTEEVKDESVKEENKTE